MAMSSDRGDPTRQGGLRPLRLLLSAMDDEIARLYDERGVVGVRPRLTMPLIRLGRGGSLTILQLAEALDVTHSAMSQTVNALKRAGLVSTSPGADARTRVVALTGRAEALLPLLEAEWRATEAAWADLEAEIPYPLSRVVTDIEAALTRLPLRDRIAQHLDAADGRS
ncbi:MAG: MarR family transcriptional regulator [Kutzneria sp.]|nr:MarR family transcriptional regulator [Kutzneria sp.]